MATNRDSTGLYKLLKITNLHYHEITIKKQVHTNNDLNTNVQSNFVVLLKPQNIWFILILHSLTLAVFDLTQSVFSITDVHL